MNNTINKMEETKEVNNTEVINFMDVLTEQLTTINLIDKQKAREEDFIFRLVICYEDKDKYINFNEYNNTEEKRQATAKAIKDLEKLIKEEKNEEKKQKAISLLEDTKKLVLVEKKEYTLTRKLIEKINRLSFKYAIKDNKYAYLVHKEDFSSLDVFKARQKTDKKGHIQLINLKNIETIYNVLNMYLLEKLVKQEKATEEEKAIYNKTIEQARKQIEEKKKQKEQEKKQATEDTKQAK